jgi:hypothetical protein
MISVSVRGTAAGEAVIIPYYTRTKLSIVTRVAACSSSGWGAPLAPDSPTEGRTAIGALQPMANDTVYFAEIEAYGLERWLGELALALRKGDLPTGPNQASVHTEVQWQAPPAECLRRCGRG